MNAADADRLYSLLPSVHRIRDADRGEPLHALLRVFGAEVDALEQDVARLYDDWFIETCAEWVVPYIGDLLGVRPIRSIPSARVSLRGYVANTVAYRRRKGTALVLEQLARDATGWPAHAVEFFQRLATTEHVNHVRLARSSVPDVRDAAAAELAGTAFGRFAHVPEMRRIGTRGGRYGVPNVGLFLWRLQSYPVGAEDASDLVTARRLADPEPNTFAFHPVGVDTPLFHVPIAETDIAHLAEEHNVPAPLRPLVLARELDAIRSNATGAPLRFMAPDRAAFRVHVRPAGSPAHVEIPAAHVYVCRVPADVALGSPDVLAVAIDPERGRLRLPPGLDVDDVRVSYAYGFPGDLGGGPYDRSDSIHAASARLDTAADSTRRGFFAPTWHAGVSHLGLTGAPEAPVFPDLRSALDAWHALPPGQTGVISLLDSVTDAADATGSPPAALQIRIPEGSRLLVTGARWPRDEDGLRRPGVIVAEDVRPHLRADVVVHGTAPDGAENAGMLVLDGLLLEGALQVADGNLGALDVRHATIVPGRGRIAVSDGNARLQIGLVRSIVGEIDVGVPLRGLALADSLVECTDTSPAFAIHSPHTPVSLDGCTVVGRVHVQSLVASDCLFTAEVEALRRQTGCVRFSFVPEGSTTPRRYRCQPELAIEVAIEQAAAAAGGPLPDAERAALRAAIVTRVKPLFASLRYGAANYGQLDRRCAREIYEGAEDGAEMGVYRFLQQPQREANLRTALREYLRFGLQSGTFFVT